MKGRGGGRGRGSVLVTGASSGIGAAIAHLLARRGVRVFGTIRRPQSTGDLERAGVTPVRMDITDQTSIATARAAVDAALDGAPLAALVNNAGIPAAGPLELLPLDELRHVLEVNLVGVVAVTQAFLPLLKAARGRIVNVSSVAGRVALPFMGPYAASKFALEAVSDSLRRELLPFGVTLIVVEPGSVRSRIWERVQAMDLTRYAGTQYERVLERVRAHALRSGERGLPPEVVARAVARALTVRRPPTRVLVVESVLTQRILEWLPARWLDRLIGRAVWHATVTPPADGSGPAALPRSAPRSRES